MRDHENIIGVNETEREFLATFLLCRKSPLFSSKKVIGAGTSGVAVSPLSIVGAGPAVDRAGKAAHHFQTLLFFVP